MAGKLKIRGVRPTTAKVKAAVFNIWRGAVPNCSWLDICAGTGAMGEAALRLGAMRVVGIETHASLCSLIEANWRKVSQPDQSWQVIRGDALQVLPRLAGTTFDLVYFDPPYHSNLYLPVLALLSPLLHQDSGIAVEHHCDRPLPTQIANLEQYDRRRYGDTALTFYRLD